MLKPEDVVQVLSWTSDKYPRAFQKCHREGDPERWDFIILACRELNKLDKNVGMNGKRGSDDPSMDAIWNDGRIVDVVQGAGGSNPSITYNDVTSAAPGKFIDPFSKETAFEYDKEWPQPQPKPEDPPKPNPKPSVECKFQPTNLVEVIEAISNLGELVKLVEEKAANAAHDARVAALSSLVIEEALRQPLTIVDGRLSGIFGGRITGNVKANVAERKTV